MYYNEKLVKIKKYYLENHDKTITQQKEFKNKKYKTGINFRLICITRIRIRQALNRKTKSISTKEILGIDNDIYRNSIKFQITPETYWTNIEIEHVKPISMFDVSDDEQLKEPFKQRNTQPLLKKDHLQKGLKITFLDYQLQFFKAYQFIRLNEEEKIN